MCDIRRMNVAPSRRSLGFASCGGAAALWGTGFFFGKIALREVAVADMVLYRFLFAVLALLPVLLMIRPAFSPADWATLAVGAFFGVPLQFLIQFHGLALTSLTHAALMVGTMPVILAGGAALFLGERLDGTGWAALAASCTGACLIAFGGREASGSTATLTGDALIVASLLISLAWIVTNKRLMARNSALSVSAWSVLLGTAMLAVWVWVVDGPLPVHGISSRAWASLAASGLLCTAATTVLWNWGMTQVSASEAGVLLNLEPVIGSALGFWFFAERLGASAWAGAALILLSATVLTTRPAGLPAVAGVTE